MTRGPVYEESCLDGVEDIERYQTGGFHPIAPAHVIGGDRYRIVHKLGAGGISTVWLARDLTARDDKDSALGRLVCLKVLRADQSPTHCEDAADVAIPKAVASLNPAIHNRLLIADKCFIERGPNGSHLCVASDVAGPNLASIFECPGRVIGNRRLRAEYSRRVAKQVTEFVHEMHSAGYAHGDLKSSNVLLRLDPAVLTWSDQKVYEVFGEPETEEVDRLDGQPRGASAPPELVEPIPAIKFMAADLVLIDAVVIDFGQSFQVSAKPPNYQPATANNYRAPETRFEGAFTLATDVWSLACLLFEIRAGAPLFNTFLGSDAYILSQMVSTLGKLPDPWWAAWDKRLEGFTEDGVPLRMLKTSVRDKLRDIGRRDEKPWEQEGPLVEKTGTRLAEEEVGLLGDLLEKMLRYRPEERITMDEVIRHPWFMYR